MSNDNDNTEHIFDESGVSYKMARIGFPLAVIVGILLLVVCVVLAVLYGTQAVAKPEEVPATQAKYEICDDEHCFYLAMRMARERNKSVDPCQDFYSYACGGWQQENPLKPNKTSITVINILNEDNYNVLKIALEQASLNYSKNIAVFKTVLYYNTCMDTAAIEAQGLEPLKQMIAYYGGWSISGNYNASVSIATRIGKAARELNVNSLFGVTSTINRLNSSKTILQLSHAELTLYRDYYISPGSENDKIREAYKTFMKAIGRMFGGKDSDKKMMAIYDFEVQLAKIDSGLESEAELMEYLTRYAKDTRSVLPDFQPTISKFCKKSEFSCPFLKEVLGIVFGQTFNGNEKLLEINIDYYGLLFRLYKNIISGNKSIVGPYITWRIVFKYISAVPANYTAVHQEYVRSISSGATKSVPRWKQCIANMMKPFGMTFGLSYVDAKLNEDSRKTIKEMTESIRSSFVESLSEQTWMDSRTREYAKQKALAMKYDIGYPAFIKNPQTLEKYFQMFKPTANYFSNQKAVSFFVKMKNIHLYGKPVDKNAWQSSPVAVNAVYYPLQNKLNIFGGILQSPIFSPEYPRYLKYGAIGMVIAHEIMHGYDTNGIRFDKDGNFIIGSTWLSKSSFSNYGTKATCLVKQYDKYKVFDKYVNGTRTIDENIADGGIRTSYNAYQTWVDKNKPEKVLPGLELNPEQLFFLGFAQSWCSNYNRAGALQQLADVHTYPKYRIIGALSNFDKFSQAFNCPVNSRMNPSTKCRVF